MPWGHTKIAMETAEFQVLTGEPVPLPNSAGLHARPAARFAATAKTYQCTIELVRGVDHVNAKSVVGIMGFGTQMGDPLQVRARGVDAVEAVTVLTDLLRKGCGEESGPSPVALQEYPAQVVCATHFGATVPSFQGVCAAPGQAVGVVVQFRRAGIEVSEVGGSPSLERLQLHAALDQARGQIETLQSAAGSAVQAKILEAHLELLQDPGLIDGALHGIAIGKSAAWAWQAACTASAQHLESLSGSSNATLRDRGNDVRDVGRRVLMLLTGAVPTSFELPDNAIVVAQELTPSDTGAFDRSKLLGFCTISGGATSHVAILARSFGIPAVCSMDPRALQIRNGTRVLLDGDQARLLSEPTDAEVSLVEQQLSRKALVHAQQLATAQSLAMTKDGYTIEVAVNVRNAQDAQEGIANGADGVGLLRSEFLFDNRDSEPLEEEQAKAYAAVADALGPQRCLVVRTLDVGGDKPLRYLPLPPEENPFLGMRGVRVSLEYPNLLRTQLRAILRTTGRARLHIMFPMVATLEEFRAARNILQEEQDRLGIAPVQVGLMIEIPSAAVMSSQFAKEADFFSIGTNDLTQYTLAMDRGHPKLAGKTDGLHPAVLKMIALTCEGAKTHGKWVGVCGSLASDLLAVPVLMGLGVTELSASVPVIPAIKTLVRRVSLQECQQLAFEVLEMGTAAQVRERLTAFSKTIEE